MRPRASLYNFVIFAVSAFSFNASALACSPPVPPKNPEELRQGAEQSFADADVVVDAVVKMPANTDSQLMGVMPFAGLETTKVWKGEVGHMFGVIGISLCDIPLTRQGARYRILLTRVDDHLFTVNASMNGLDLRDRAAFDQEIDRLVGNRRPLEFARVGYAGAPISPDGSHIAFLVDPPSPFQNRTVQLAGLAIFILSSLATGLFLRTTKQTTGNE